MSDLRMRFICAGGAIVECPQVLAPHFEVHQLCYADDRPVEVTKDIRASTMQTIVELLGNSDEQACEASLFLSDDLPFHGNTSLDAMDLAASIELYHCAHYLGLELLSRQLSKRIYLRFVNQQELRDAVLAFEPFKPWVDSGVQGVHSETERTTSLAADEWIGLLYLLLGLSSLGFISVRI